MKHYYVWSTDILGHVYMQEFESEIEAKAYAEVTGQNFYLHIDPTVDVKAIKIDKAVSDYLAKKKKHIEI